MAFKEIQIWDCPFCNKNVIKIVYIPKTFRQYKTTWGGSKPGTKVTKQQIYLLVKECPNCKKSAQEIEKLWKEEGIL